MAVNYGGSSGIGGRWCLGSKNDRDGSCGDIASIGGEVERAW